MDVDEYLKLLRTHCSNQEVKAAFLFSCYTRLRWVDVKEMNWTDVKEGVLTTIMIQAKTGEPVIITLHPIADLILNTARKRAAVTDHQHSNVFQLPSANDANKILGEWMASARIKKHITWSCARLSFSILLQDSNVDDATALIIIVSSFLIISLLLYLVI